MRVCIISRTLNRKGGISRYNAEIADHLCRYHDIHVLTAWCENVSPYITVHKYSIPRNPYFLQISTSFFKVSSLAKKLDEKFSFDVIHSSEAEGMYQDVITAHSCIRAAFERLSFNNALYDFLRRVRPFTFFGLETEKLMYCKRKYKKIIAVSSGIKREIVKYYGVPNDDIVVIPNGVDLEEFRPNRRKREKIRGQLKIDENEVVLMFSGYEFKRKGLMYIIEALPKIKEDVKLLVIGKDNPKPYRKLASKLGVIDKVIFMGFVQDISEYYAASDIFVFPTLYEAFSLVTLEAVASGLPILATKVNGTEELIVNGYNGFFIERNGNDIAEKVNILVDDDGLRKKMSKNARKTAENYSWDKIAKKTLEVYEEVAKR